MIYVGADVSLTSTGIAVFVNNDFEKTLTIKTDIPNGGVYRIKQIVTKLFDILKGYDKKNLIVIVEDFSYASKGRSILEIAQLGGVIRYLLYTHNYKYFLIPPKVVKKFVSGNGNADKNLMKEIIEKKYKDNKFKNDDECDAVGLVETFLGLQDYFGDNKYKYTVEQMKTMEKVESRYLAFKE